MTTVTLKRQEPSDCAPGHCRTRFPSHSRCEVCNGEGYTYETVTRDMASDAGDPALEGAKERTRCERCHGMGW